jgi:hypothetical protein
LSETEIVLFLNEGQEYLISGFPRCLMQDGRDKTSQSRPLAHSDGRHVLSSFRNAQHPLHQQPPLGRQDSESAVDAPQTMDAS